MQRKLHRRTRVEFARHHLNDGDGRHDMLLKDPIFSSTSVRWVARKSQDWTNA